MEGRNGRESENLRTRSKYPNLLHQCLPSGSEHLETIYGSEKENITITARWLQVLQNLIENFIVTARQLRFYRSEREQYC